jgi:nucleoside-diphosphate-sugar epimerase
MALFPGHGRNDTEAGYANVGFTRDAVDEAARLGCRRFIAVGSQAEYGVRNDLITEDLPARPFSMYGAAKAAACQLSRIQARVYGMEWVYGRIFSLIGKYEPAGRLIPDIIRQLGRGEEIHLSAATQNWDYLDAGDCAEAFIAIAERGRDGEIYNVANGDWHELKYYTEMLRSMYGPETPVIYGAEADPRVSLQPSVEKIYADTGWKAEISFEESVRSVYG